MRLLPTAHTLFYPTRIFLPFTGTVRRFLEKLSDIDLVIFVVENADEVRLIYFS